MTKSILSTHMMNSPIASASVLKPQGKGRMTSLAAALAVTSLVDAFCMIVIYLMFNISPSQEAAEMKIINIPTALHSETFTPGIVIRVENNRYFMNDKEIPAQALASELAPFKVSPETPADQVRHLVIQADRDLNFSAFNPIITAGAQNGFTTFKFAVINGGQE